MSRSDKVTVFSSEVHEETVADMKAKRESVHAPGERIFTATGKIPDEVNVYGKRRVSRNSLDMVDGTLRLTNGVALPWMNTFDITTSMGKNVEICFYELATLFDMTGWLREQFNLQIANSGVQDILDVTPVFQMTQFESSNLIAKQLRLIVSGEWGLDPTEDYDFAEAFTNYRVSTDIYDLYRLKGLRFVIGDEKGRGVVYSTDPDANEEINRGLDHHLGFTLPNNKQMMTTKEITQALNQRWWQFYLQVAVDRPAARNSTTRWWEENMGPGHVVLMPSADLLAETQVSIAYLLHTSQVSETEYMDFIMEVTRNANDTFTREDAEKIWKALQEAGIDVGAQTRLPNFGVLPNKMDDFEHDRHAWPKGHKNFHLNVIPDEDPADTPKTPGESRASTDWSMF